MFQSTHSDSETLLSRVDDILADHPDEAAARAREAQLQAENFSPPRSRTPTGDRCGHDECGGTGGPDGTQRTASPPVALRRVRDRQLRHLHQADL